MLAGDLMGVGAAGGCEGFYALKAVAVLEPELVFLARGEGRKVVEGEHDEACVVRHLGCVTVGLCTEAMDGLSDRLCKFHQRFRYGEINSTRLGRVGATSV